MIKRNIHILGCVAVAGLVMSLAPVVQAQTVTYPGMTGNQQEQYQQQMTPAQQEYMSNLTIDELMDIQRQAAGGRSPYSGYFDIEEDRNATSNTDSGKKAVYRYKKKDPYFDGVEMPKRIFNNLPSKRY